VSNFLAIGQTVGKIWRFSIFQDGGGGRHLGFLKLQILTVRRFNRVELRHHAKSTVWPREVSKIWGHKKGKRI